MTPITISLIAFGCVAVGVLLGARGHSLLSEKYRSADTKEVVGLGTGLVGTTVALVLGLLIGSAKNFYDTQNSEMTEIAATAILLDRILAHYGPGVRGVPEHRNSERKPALHLVFKRCAPVSAKRLHQSIRTHWM